MASLQINNFKGMSMTQGLWNQGYAAYVMGVDVNAISDIGAGIGANLVYPGIIQPQKLMAIQTEAAATDNITDVINSFAYYPTDSSLWAFGSDERLYKYVSGATWTKQRAGAGVDFPAGANSGSACKLINFRTILHVIYDDGYATWDNTTWTSSANTFTTGTQSPRPAVILNDNLYIGNGRYVSRIDDAGNFTAEAATLPEDYIIRSIDVFNNRIYISADNDNLATIFVWDGVSAESDRVENLENHSVAPIIKAVGGVLWVFATLPGAYINTWIYTFNGSSFNKVFTMPFKVIGANDGPAIYNGGLLFPTTETSTGIYEGGTGGIWMINRNSVGEAWQISMPFNVGSDGQEQVTLGTVHASDRSVTAGVRDISGTPEYGVWGTTTYDNTAGEWISLPIDAGDFTRNKTWHGIQIETDLPFQTYNASRDVVISYRTDPNSNDGSWTELKTITTNTDPSPHLYIPIGAVSNTIAIRFKIGAPASSQGTRIRSFTLDYTLHPR